MTVTDPASSSAGLQLDSMQQGLVTSRRGLAIELAAAALVLRYGAKLVAKWLNGKQYDGLDGELGSVSARCPQATAGCPCPARMYRARSRCAASVLVRLQV